MIYLDYASTTPIRSEVLRLMKNTAYVLRKCGRCIRRDEK